MKGRFVAGAAVACALLCSSSGIAQDWPNLLVGKWHSDKAMTVKYNHANARTDAATAQFMDDLPGHATFMFTADHVISDVEAFDVHKDGKVVHIPASHQERQYRILGANSTQMLISVAAEGGPGTITYNFDNKNTMWFVWSGDAVGADIPESREYFSRVK